VTVQIGSPIYPNAELDQAESVVELRNRTRAAVIAMLGGSSSAETVAEPTQPL
jgi:hypothetical protein